jgi:hypothetical protein
LGLQQTSNDLISRNILAELCLPEVTVGFWIVSKAASGMSMPEAAVHKDHRIPRWQNNIWASSYFLA